MKRITPLAVALCLHTEACRDTNAQEAAPVAVRQQPNDSGRFVSHLEHIQAGGMPVPRGLVLRNPYEGNASVVATGEKLYVAYNCIDCHGAGGSGAIGPSLADGRWHFGGSAPEVYESIYQGRAEGMPAWGSLLSSDQIWMLVTYVRTLERGKDLTTENFTGATVERTGH